LRTGVSIGEVHKGEALCLAAELSGLSGVEIFCLVKVSLL